jgi:radical SAM superfamily enzyme YgiQ (UPF0313 family)
MTHAVHYLDMRTLLVQSRSPRTYWSFERSLPFIDKAATMPPLGLATLAAHLPKHWELRLRDLNVAPLEEVDLRWAEVVLVSGMLVQAESVREVLSRARALGRLTVVGGAGPSIAPELFPEADHVFRGEAEGRLGLLVDVLEGRVTPAPRLLSVEDDARPDLSLAHVPRFDLVELSRYANHALQYSRGCPFHCEFCDIIELFGQVPRVKAPEQVVAELDALYACGARGALFFVDDNFIGNRREVARLLPVVQAWQERHGFPFQFCTEASLDLAAAPELVSSMVAAGFQEVFLGIESPSTAVLRETGKTQNLRMPASRAVEILTRAGLEVFAGFIVGFDSEGNDIFDQQLDLVSALPIPRAMVGLLMALPGTRLWRRLEKEGRLRGHGCGDNFERPNFVPAMDERVLLAGFRRVVAALYAPDRYYARCALAVAQLPLRARAAADAGTAEGSPAAVARIVWGIGIRSPRRLHFWRLVAHALRRGLGALPRALALAVLGESLIPYTYDVVLPRLDRAIADLGPPSDAQGVAASA